MAQPSPLHSESSASNSAITEAALAYAGRGWRVLPVYRRGKHPSIQDWPRRATTDPAVIRGWLRRWPDMNIGITTGMGSDLVVIDVDGEAGMAALQELQRHAGELPETVTVKTARGHHLYYRYPDESLPSSSGKMGANIDMLSDGRFAVAPPSLHDSGHRYAWEIEPEGTLPKLPDWVLERLRPAQPPPRPVRPLFPGPATDAYAAAALRGECEAVAQTSKGGRNNRLNLAAFQLGTLVAGGHLAEDVVVAALTASALADGLDEAAAAATIRSGLRAGSRYPRRQAGRG